VLCALTASAAAQSTQPSTENESDAEKRRCIASSTDGQERRSEGHLLRAHEQFWTCANESCPLVVRQHCVRWLAELDELTPGLIVHALDADGSDRANVTLRIDGKVVRDHLDGLAVRIDPGEHIIRLEDRQDHYQEQNVLAVEGETKRVLRLQLPATPTAATRPELAGARTDTHSTSSGHRSVPTGVWLLGGAGLVLLGGSAYLAVKTASDYQTLKETCAPGCSSAQTRQVRTQIALTDVSLGVGVAALAGATAWWYFSSRPSSTATAAAILPTNGGGMLRVTKPF